MKRVSFNPDIWHQGWFQKLPTEAKLLYVYFKTNTRLNIIGVGEFSPYQVSLDTGIDIESMERALQTLDAEIAYALEGDVLWIWLKSELKEYSSPSIMKGAKKLLTTLEIPDSLREKILAAYGHLLPSDETASFTTVTLSRREVVAIRDGFKCQYCGKEIHSADDLEIDHVTPRAKGGADNYENLLLSCRRCNREKLDLPPEQKGVYQSQKIYGKTDALRALRNPLTFEMYRRVFLRGWKEKSEGDTSDMNTYMKKIRVKSQNSHQNMRKWWYVEITEMSAMRR